MIGEIQIIRCSLMKHMKNFRSQLLDAQEGSILNLMRNQINCTWW